MWRYWSWPALALLLSTIVQSLDPAAPTPPIKAEWSAGRLYRQSRAGFQHITEYLTLTITNPSSKAVQNLSLSFQIREARPQRSQPPGSASPLKPYFSIYRVFTAQEVVATITPEPGEKYVTLPDRFRVESVTGERESIRVAFQPPSAAPYEETTFVSNLDLNQCQVPSNIGPSAKFTCDVIPPSTRIRVLFYVFDREKHPPALAGRVSLSLGSYKCDLDSQDPADDCA
jgi:hypothetical protein